MTNRAAFSLIATVLMLGLWFLFRGLGSPYDIVFAFFGSICLWAMLLALGERLFESGGGKEGDHR